MNRQDTIRCVYGYDWAQCCSVPSLIQGQSKWLLCSFSLERFILLEDEPTLYNEWLSHEPATGVCERTLLVKHIHVVNRRHCIFVSKVQVQTRALMMFSKYKFQNINCL